MKRKVLVTGGAGYIGAHTVVELSQAGYEVIIVDNMSRSDRTLLAGIKQILGYDPAFEMGDCADKAFLKRVFAQHGPFHAVLHFAAFKSVGESVEQPLLYYQNNIGSLVSLLEVMKEFHVTNIIFSSSCTVYGQPDHTPVDEQTAFKRAESPYGSTKQMGERILEDLATTFRIVSLRYFNPIGAHPGSEIGELPIGAPNNLVPYLTQTAAGVRKELVIFGGDYNTPDGTCIRDFIHVVDLAQAHLKAVDYLNQDKRKAFLEVFNLGTGVGLSVLSVVKEFIRVTKVNLNYRIGQRRPGDVEQVYADPAKANRELGWRTERSITDSLLDAWNWEKKIRNL